MKSCKFMGVTAALAGLLMLLPGLVRPLLAQTASSAGLTLWVDQRTHQVFTVPGRNRTPLVLGGAVNTDEIVQKVQQRTQDQIQAEIAQSEAQNRADNAAVEQQVTAMKPAWKDYMDNFQDKFRIGTLFYGDYRFYTHTGFQPQELTQINNPGPWNNDYNSFDITRTYLNIYFFPTKDWTLRLTPNMYKTIGSANDKIGANTGFGSNLDGNLGVRMKYAYLQYSDLWKNVSVMKGGTVTIGELPNPLVGWEEDLYGYRFVNLTPWNYLSLSSTQLGAAMAGPIKPFGGETAYADYDFGVYNNSSFHAYEQTSTKQFMGRLTLYPFGSNWRFQGLGLTGFWDYGWGNTTPDSSSLKSTALKSGTGHVERIAALLHYSAEQWGVAGEFDYGENAFTTSNLFSGSGPADNFGSVTGSAVKAPAFGNPCSSTTPCYNPLSGFGSQTAAWQAILNNGQARQVGFDFFGHYHIPGTKFTPFGMFEWLQPNDKFRNDPLDFQRFIVGVSYQYNEFLRFALDSQNFLFYHSQQARSVTELEKVGYVPGSKGGKLNGQYVPSTGVIPYLVPFDTHSIFLNVEFSY